MKRLSKILTMIIASILLLSSVGCKEDEVKPTNVGYTDMKNYTFQGTHIYDTEESELPFIVNGKTDYVLVTPSVKNDVILNAQEEFAYFFKMATDINIGTISDSELANGQHQAGTKYISLGQTTLLESSNLPVDKSVLSADGYRIVTLDTNVYIYGTTDYAARFGVYGFMKAYFNYQPYTVNTWEIDRNVKNINLKIFNITDVPDFDYRRSTHGSMDTFYATEYDHVNFARRMGISDHMHPEIIKACNVDTLEPVGWGETNMVMIPRDGKTGSQHPKWFSNNGSQWCYTAHGDEAEYEALVEAVSSTVYQSLKIYNPKDHPRKHILCIDIADNRNGCSCEACATMAEQYGGSNAAALVKFLNRIAANVRTWFEDPANAEYYREDFKIMTLAYLHMTAAPTYYDKKTKSYKPYDQSVVCDDMIMVDLANIDADWQQSVFSEGNKDAYDINNGWAAICKNVRWYIYPENLRCDLSFYDNFCIMDSKEMQYYASLFNGETMMYYEEMGGSASSRFANLKAYLNARLMWDTSLDSAELIEDYFRAVYGNAASYMKQYFNDVRMFTYSQNLKHGLFKSNSVMNYCYLTYEWSEKTLYKWLEYGDSAKEAVSNLASSDPENYSRICANIEMEMIMPIYFLIDQCETLNPTQKTELKDRVLESIEKWPNIGKIQTITKGAYQGRYTVNEWIVTI